MTEKRPPLGIRLLHAVRKEPDWAAMTTEELAAYRDAENRRRASGVVRLISGFPHPGATIQWQDVTLPDRVVRIRVYRPHDGADLPLVLHIHGGGFVGTAVQSDWINSHLAVDLPARVVSVEHRLVAPGTPMSAAVDDAWDILEHFATQERIAVFGESAGGLIAALLAIRAKGRLRAQVLVNPAVDLTETMFDHASMAEHAHSPTLSIELMRLFHRLAVPPGSDPHAVSPLRAEDLSDLAPALVVVPTHDPLADHGRRYAERLVESGTSAQLTEHPGATHAFVSMPGLVPQAKVARTEITEFLRAHL